MSDESWSALSVRLNRWDFISATLRVWSQGTT